MSSALECLCPVFLQRTDSEEMEHVATSVAITLADRVFLLTAAHVLDHRNDGVLYIPTKIGLEQLIGRMISLEVPNLKSRDDDKVDAAYVELDESLASNLDDSIRPLQREEIALFDFNLENDLYTFGGFPWRRTKISRSRARTELVTFTGELVGEARYKSLGYSLSQSIIVKFRRKKARQMQSGQMQVAPLPHGISGGGVFRWQKDFGMTERDPELKLVAVGHTYLQRQHVLVGTRMPLYLGLIERSHPEVLASAGPKYNPEPILMGMVWYIRDEWDELMSDFADARNMPDSWEEWRNKAEEGIEELSIAGKLAIPIEVTAEEIRDFCKHQELTNNGYSRSSLAGFKMAEHTLERELVKVKAEHPAEFRA